MLGDFPSPPVIHLSSQSRANFNFPCVSSSTMTHCACDEELMRFLGFFQFLLFGWILLSSYNWQLQVFCKKIYTQGYNSSGAIDLLAEGYLDLSLWYDLNYNRYNLQTCLQSISISKKPYNWRNTLPCVHGSISFYNHSYFKLHKSTNLSCYMHAWRPNSNYVLMNDYYNKHFNLKLGRQMFPFLSKVLT